jgi:hypothetical protein
VTTTRRPWNGCCLCSTDRGLLKKSNISKVLENLETKAGRALDRIGAARNGTVRRDKNQWSRMEGRALHRPGSARHRLLRHASEQFRNTGQTETFRRSEACGRPIPASKRGFFCVFFLQ